MGDLSEFVDRINDISLEVDYGMQYMIGSLHDGRTFHSEYMSIAYGKMFECRELLSSWVDITSGSRRYPHSDDPTNDYVEPRDVIVDPEFVSIDKGVEKHIHLKYLRNGTSELSRKLTELIREANMVEDVHLLHSAGSSLEIAYIWLREELIELKRKYPNVHSKLPTKESSGANKVDKIIEDRVKKSKK